MLEAESRCWENWHATGLGGEVRILTALQVVSLGHERFLPGGTHMKKCELASFCSQGEDVGQLSKLSIPQFTVLEKISLLFSLP